MSADKEFLVTCSVCLCDYDDESRKQKFLPCLHSFCQSCLTQVKQFDRIKCPICRCEVRLLSGDVSTLPDTYFECLREMEKKMKEIQLKEMEKTRKIEEMKQEKEEMKREKEEMKREKEKMKREKEKMKQEQEEMKRKIAQQGGQIDLLRWSKNRLAADCDELKRFNQHMETVVVSKDRQICSLKKFATTKKLEDTQNQKRPDEAQTERNEDLYFPDPEDIFQLRDEADGENALRDLLYPEDPSEDLNNEEWIDHQDYIEESNEEESRCMNAFEDDFCDSMADHLEFLNIM
uniref:RING-type domain-containing protein n=1 Tax=Daphnia galeata TaxID=27404 RepID=A0A8J2S276_9CRUS|nr:unnamed protein product [Daphnia galeata]